MAQLTLGAKAPEFELPDWQGKTVQLSDYQNQKHVVLVLNRTFM